MKVRKAGGDDAAAIAEIHVRSWQAAYRGVLPDELLDDLSVSERETSWRALLSAGEDRQLTLVAEREGGDLLGFCSVTMPSRDEEADERTAETARSTWIPSIGATERAARCSRRRSAS